MTHLSSDGAKIQTLVHLNTNLSYSHYEKDWVIGM